MKKSKILSLVLALALAVSMLAGCGGEGGTTSGLNDDVLKLEGALCSAEPLTLTAHIHFYNTNVFDESWYWNVEGAKATNVSLKGTASKVSSDSAQEFNTMLVGDVLPDIIHGEGAKLCEAGRDGALIPLQDLVKKYAPNIQKAFDEFPVAYNSVLDVDGNLYYIPLMNAKQGPQMGWFIRQDWLDKLGLEAPKTKDEVYSVLKAFRDNDPNGNGKKDEVPYFDRTKSVKNLLQLWDLPVSEIALNDKGEMYAVKTTDTFKEAMKELSKWYAEGLLDQEMFSRTSQREELFGNNLGGLIVDWFSSTMAFENSMSDRINGFDLSVIAPPANINGTQNNYNTRPMVTAIGWGISRDNKHVAETMKYFDYWYSDEGRKLKGFGVEGVHHYVDENGELQFTDAIWSAEGGAAAEMRKLGNVEIGAWGNAEAETKDMTDEAAEGFKMYVDNNYQVTPLPTLAKTEEEKRVITEKESAIVTFISEYMQHWTMGSKDVDATWDEYIAGLNSLGVQEWVSVYQSAYDRVFK